MDYYFDLEAVTMSVEANRSEGVVHISDIPVLHPSNPIVDY